MLTKPIFFAFWHWKSWQLLLLSFFVDKDIRDYLALFCILPEFYASLNDYDQHHKKNENECDDECLVTLPIISRQKARIFYEVLCFDRGLLIRNEPLVQHHTQVIHKTNVSLKLLLKRIYELLGLLRLISYSKGVDLFHAKILFYICTGANGF